MALKVVNQPLENKVKSCTSDFKTRNKKRPTHNGMDLTSKSGTNNYVISVADGVVSNVGYDSKSGYYVFVKHEVGVYSFYCHLKKSSTLVKKGQKVTKETRLGLMGATGSAQGVHLHYAIKKNGVWVDPKPSLEEESYFILSGKHYPDEYPKLPLRGYFCKGDKGSEVKKLQKLLNWCNGCKLDTDGILGAKTITQVDLFESNNKLTIDGKFGKKCLEKAHEITK